MAILRLYLPVALFLGLTVGGVPADKAHAREPLQFSRDVLPILSENCFACHGFDEAAREADLRLDILEGATAELDSGQAAVVPGNPQASVLLQRVEAANDDERMPPIDSGKRLTAEQRATLRQWIAQGAEYERHWSFEPPRAEQPPHIPGVAHPIDRFIQQRLASKDLTASPPAEDTTLIRRVSLDLLGLPPTPAEVDAFVAAAAIDRQAAYAELVERLLQNPHYGERWGRWWLDQARYADSNGYSIDAPREIWKYRDWVIDALNADMPFDQFTIEQIAGDLLPQATLSQKIATGFHRNTQINQEGGIDREQFRVDSVFDRVATTGTVWLGLTIGCAQCHDHKFDPLTQTEYYRLFAFFNNQDEPTLTVYPSEAVAADLEDRQSVAERAVSEWLQSQAEAFAAWEEQLAEPEKEKLSAALKKILDLPPEQRSGSQTRQLYAGTLGREDKEFQQRQKQLKAVEAEIKQLPTTLVMAERWEPRQTTLLIKGDFTRPAAVVTPGTPAVLPPLPSPNDASNASDTTAQADRLALARWIVSPENPLTARVIVNRVWQVYFGRGLVETENDFGTLGTPPSHPRLLDWLAVELQRKQWSLKELHRLIVLSHTYRQASTVREDLQAVDPHNYLLGRQQRLRLEAEIIRDVSLAASGLLSPKLGGPPVFPPIPEGVMNQGQVTRDWNVSAGEDRYRRGIYTFVYRATPPPSLNVFDAPDGYSTCTRRARSNTPLQALTLLNDAAFFELATALEKIIRQDGLEQAFRRCTARLPSDEERALLSQLDPQSAARVLLNLDETMTRE